MLKKKLTVGVVALFLSISVIPNVIGNNSIFGKTIYVDEDQPYEWKFDNMLKGSHTIEEFAFNGVFPFCHFATIALYTYIDT